MAKNADNKTPMTKDAASRIQGTADKDANSRTADTGFKERAQSSAAKNEGGGKKK